MMLALFDQETLMKNHDASVERKAEKRTADLMNYLWSNGRGDDAKRASTDEGFLNKLLTEFSALSAAK